MNLRPQNVFFSHMKELKKIRYFPSYDRSSIYKFFTGTRVSDCENNSLTSNLLTSIYRHNKFKHHEIILKIYRNFRLQWRYKGLVLALSSNVATRAKRCTSYANACVTRVLGKRGGGGLVKLARSTEFVPRAYISRTSSVSTRVTTRENILMEHVNSSSSSWRW